MKKIALIIDTWFPLIGGGQLNAFELSRRIAKDNFSIDIITRNCGKDDLILPKNLRVIKLGKIQNPHSITSKMRFLVNSSFFLFKNDYDIIHAHAFLPGIVARTLSVFKGVPTIFTVHGTSLKSGLNNKFKELFEKWILTGILYNVQITVSRDFLNLKNVNKKIVYISNGINLKSDKRKLKNSREVSLLFVGRLHKQKNVDTLIKSMPLLQEEFPRLKLTIVGDGEEKFELRQLCKKLGLGRSVVFTGNLKHEKLIKYYESSSILVLPSLYEGTPIVLLEAWGSKLPVAVSSTGDCPYLVKEGFNGFLIKDPKNISEIANVINKALKHKNLSKLGQNGYNFVAKNFSWEKSASLTKNVYADLLKTQN